jgi:hypothetical protein
VLKQSVAEIDQHPAIIWVLQNIPLIGVSVVDVAERRCPDAAGGVSVDVYGVVHRCIIC